MKGEEVLRDSGEMIEYYENLQRSSRLFPLKMDLRKMTGKAGNR